jgi:hypothetical protein
MPSQKVGTVYQMFVNCAHFVRGTLWIKFVNCAHFVRGTLWTAPGKRHSNPESGTFNPESGTVQNTCFLPISPRKTAFSYMRARALLKTREEQD